MNHMQFIRNTPHCEYHSQVSTCHTSTKSNALLNLLSQLPTALPAHLNAHPAVLKNRQEWSVDTSTYHPGPTLKTRVTYVNSRSMQPQQEPMNQLLSWRCTFHVHRNTDCIQWQFAPTATYCSCRSPSSSSCRDALPRIPDVLQQISSTLHQIQALQVPTGCQRHPLWTHIPLCPGHDSLAVKRVQLQNY